MTITMGGTDIGIALLVKLRKFIEEKYVVFCRDGGPLTHKHFQSWSMAKSILSSCTIMF